MFDEVMGLGEFADSSTSSATSSKSCGQDEAKGEDETSGQGEHQPVEEDSNSSRQEEKIDEGAEGSAFPRSDSLSSDQRPSFKLGINKAGGGRSGGAALDNALDGLTSYEQEEEEDEAWHFALPMDTLEDADVSKANQKRSQSTQENSSARGDSVPHEHREAIEDQAASSGSATTSHSSKDNTPENSQGTSVYLES